MKPKLFSAANKSEEITEMSLPELVAMRDRMDRLMTFSKMTTTRVCLAGTVMTMALITITITIFTDSGENEEL